MKYLRYMNLNIAVYLSKMIFTNHPIVNRRHIYVYIVHSIKVNDNTIDRVLDIINYIFDPLVAEKPNKKVSNVDKYLIRSIKKAETIFGRCELLLVRLDYEYSLLGKKRIYLETIEPHK